MSLAAKLIKGSSISLMEQGIKLALMFVTTPLMIRELGDHDYGIWLLSLAIVAYFRLLDLGISFSGTRFLGKALGAKDSEEYSELAATLFRLFHWIGIATLVATGLTVLLLPFFLENDASSSTIRLVVGCFGVVTAIRFWTRIFETILKSHVRYDLIGIASIVRSLIQGGLVIGFLLAGHGLATLVIVYLASDAIDQLLLFGFARRVEPKLRLLPFSRKGAGRIKELVTYSATAMATSAGHSMRHGIDPLIVAKVSSVEAVPVYSVGARFLTVFTDIINSIFGGNFVAAFSQLHGRNDDQAMRERFLETVRFSTAVAAVGGCGLVMFAPTFITRWVGEGFEESASVLWILTPPTTLALMLYPIWSFFYSQNRQHWLALLTVIGGLLNLVLSFALAFRIGFLGVVWATMIELTLAYLVVIPVLLHRLFSIHPTRLLGILGFNALKVVVPAVLYFLLIREFLVADYFRLLLLGLGLVAVAVPVIWFLVLKPDERQRILDTFLKRSRAR